MPSAAKIGGVNPGTIVIKGTVASTSDLPTGVVGDAYVIDGNLRCHSSINIY